MDDIGNIFTHELKLYLLSFVLLVATGVFAQTDYNICGLNKISNSDFKLDDQDPDVNVNNWMFTPDGDDRLGWMREKTAIYGTYLFIDKIGKYTASSDDPIVCGADATTGTGAKVLKFRYNASNTGPFDFSVKLGDRVLLNFTQHGLLAGSDVSIGSGNVLVRVDKEYLLEKEITDGFIANNIWHSIEVYVGDYVGYDGTEKLQLVYERYTGASRQIRIDNVELYDALVKPELSANSGVIEDCSNPTFNLNTITATNAPPGATVEWHTVPNNPSAATLVANPTSVNIGTYYVYYNGSDCADCYSPASNSIQITSNCCGEQNEVANPSFANGVTSWSLTNTVPRETGIANPSAGVTKNYYLGSGVDVQDNGSVGLASASVLASHADIKMNIPAFQAATDDNVFYCYDRFGASYLSQDIDICPGDDVELSFDVVANNVGAGQALDVRLGGILLGVFLVDHNDEVIRLTSVPKKITVTGDNLSIDKSFTLDGNGSTSIINPQYSLSDGQVYVYRYTFTVPGSFITQSSNSLEFKFNAHNQFFLDNVKVVMQKPDADDPTSNNANIDCETGGFDLSKLEPTSSCHTYEWYDGADTEAANVLESTIIREAGTYYMRTIRHNCKSDELKRVIINFTCPTVSGTVYQDYDGASNRIDQVGTTPAETTSGGGLWIYLVNASNNIEKKQKLHAVGTYSFPLVPDQNYRLILHNEDLAIGTTLTTAQLNPSWVSIGETVNETLGNYSSNVDFQSGASNTNTEIDFGIQVQPIPSGSNSNYCNHDLVPKQVPNLYGVDDDPNFNNGVGQKVIIQTVTQTNGTLTYDSNTVTDGYTINSYDPTLLIFTPANAIDEAALEFTYIFEDASGTQSAESVIVRMNIAGDLDADITATASSYCASQGTPTLIEFTGLNGVFPYTFTYTENDGAQQEITTTQGENSVNIPFTKTDGNTYIYKLFSVKDAIGCTQDITPNKEVVIIAKDCIDSDNDGVLDYEDLDDDNDGILDTVEGNADFDNDGIPNSLDLDSDGDGCPDALEANSFLGYADLASNDAIDTSTIGVDDNGVPTALQATGIGSSQDNTVQADECNACNENSILFVDSDTDGIGNACDLDDDNDGILDIDECKSKVDGFDLLIKNEAATNSKNFSVTAERGVVVEIYGLDNSFNLTINNTPIAPGEIEFSTSSFNSNTEVFAKFKSDNRYYGSNGIGNVWTVNYNLLTSITQFKLIINKEGEITLLGKRTATSSFEEMYLTSNSTTTNVIPFNTIPWDATGTNTVTISQSYENTPNKTKGVVYALICPDTDGDGISDYLDLDSDGDGCPDAIEGGDNVIESHLSNDRIDIVNQGGVDPNGVPNLVNVGGSDDTDNFHGQSVHYAQDATRNSCINFWHGGTLGSINDWDTTTNWTELEVPAPGNDVVFATATNNNNDPAASDLHVPGDSDNPTVIGNLINESDKALVVPVDKAIEVQGKVTGSSNPSDASKIQVLATGDHANGSLLLLGQCGNGDVYGTVQLYAKGFKDSPRTWTDNILGSPTNGTLFTASYHWQHFGVPVEEIVAYPTFLLSFLKEYDESKNAPDRYYEKWKVLNNESKLTAFKGYEITQDTATTYTIVGKLQFCDKELIMTRQASEVSGSTDVLEGNRRYGLGQNVFGNSYTASINVDQIEFPVEVEKTVYLYNTGRFTDWANVDVTTGLNDGTTLTAGQYTAIPKNVSPAIYDQGIPSMNGFLLRFTDDETKKGPGDPVQVPLKYTNGGVQPNTRPQTVPRSKLSYLDIVLSSKSTVDRLWLFSEEGTSDNFDNGWDGHKFFRTPTAFIYSETGDGPMQVNTSNTLHEKVISFYSNEDKEYALYLNKNNLDEKYQNLNLLDLETKKITPLDNLQTVYHFTSTGLNTTFRRFKLVNSKNITSEMLSNVSNLSVSSYGHTISVKNYTEFVGSMFVYDVTGRLVLLDKDMRVGQTSYQVDFLEKGSYIVRLSAGNEVESFKIIVSQ